MHFFLSEQWLIKLLTTGDLIKFRMFFDIYRCVETSKITIKPKKLHQKVFMTTKIVITTQLICHHNYDKFLVGGNKIPTFGDILSICYFKDCKGEHVDEIIYKDIQGLIKDLFKITDNDALICNELLTLENIYIILIYFREDNI